MKDQRISEEESWQLIQQMIQVAKEEHQESGIGWLLWGWQLFAASVLSVVLAYLEWWNYISWVWTGMLLLGVIIYTFSRARRREQQVVKTYVQEMLQKFGTAFFISLFVMVAASFISKASFAFGYFYVLYAFWMYIRGSAIRFRPLIIGAVVNWAAAIAIFMIKDFKYDMMVSAVAVLVGYLIPGYMLRAKYRNRIPS
jgi:Flp pilus assembly protein TadB